MRRLAFLLALPLTLFGQEHESTVLPVTFPPLPLELEALRHPDDEFARVAEAIARGTASMQERRWWYRTAERYAPFQGMPETGWRMRAAQAAAALGTPPANVTYRWSSIGPDGNYDVSGVWGPAGARNQGRATAVWTHLNGSSVVNKNIIFLGFADGGLWKSIDGGTSWAPLTDFQPSLSVGAVDVVPGTDLVSYSDATIYVGTGEGNFSQPDKDGVGVLKSTDGGRSWVVQPLPWRTDALDFAGLHRIRRIAVDRNVPGAQSVWAAGDGGVYRTTNGGATWTLVTGLPYSGAPADAAYPGGCWNEFATDFAVLREPLVNGASVLLAVFGNRRDDPCAVPVADSRKHNGLYRSLDGGLTWTKVTVGGQNGFTPAIPGFVGRMTLLVAPSNPKHVYLLIARSDTFASHGIFDTLDVTATPVVWEAGSTTNFTAAQGWYNITGAVHPTNENRLMVGGLDNWISSNRGKSIQQVSGWSARTTFWAHADHHHAVWVDDTTYYDANDGGLNVGKVTGTSSVVWEHRNAGGLSTLQFYGLGQSAANPYRINAGLQDNGHAYLNGANPPVWRATAGGDGGFAATDQSNDNEVYEEYVYGAIRNSDNGGASFPTQGCMKTFGTPPCQDTSVATCGSGCIPDNHTAFIANFMLDVHNQNVMYVGSNWLYRNPDARNTGKAWQRITTDGQTGDFVNGATSSRAYISIIHTPKGAPSLPHDLAPALTQTLYVGTSTGRIWKSTTAGVTWTDLTKPPLPVNSPTTGRFLTWIDTDPTNPDRVVLTYSGWSNSTKPDAIPGHVFRSTDGGATWTDISGGLPDEPFNSVAVNPNAGETSEVYAASDFGIYVNPNAWTGDRWYRINGSTLPHVSINMLQFTNATNPKRLRAATHGRGIWELFKECPPESQIDDASAAIEYGGGWHRRQDAQASGGGYHRRVGGTPNGPHAAVVFEGDAVTYSYVAAEKGGSADLYLDGVLRETVSYGGSPVYGRSITLSGLGPGVHELRLVHRSGTSTVDGFRFACGSGGADASAAELTSITSVSTASPSEGPVVTRTVGASASDVAVSVVVEGALAALPAPLTVKLVDPSGALVATGQALLAGATVSGLDAPISAAGTYRVQVLQPPLGAVPITISIARTVKTAGP